jgi:hypothetical protein
MCHTVAEKVTARKKSPVFALLLSLFHGGEVFVESEGEVTPDRSSEVGNRAKIAWRVGGAFRVFNSCLEELLDQHFRTKFTTSSSTPSHQSQSI